MKAIGRKEAHQKWGRTDHIGWHATVLERLAREKGLLRRERQLSPQQQVANHWDVSKRTVADALTDRRHGNEILIDKLIAHGQRYGRFSEMEVLVGEAQLAADNLQQWNRQRELARALMQKKSKLNVNRRKI